MAEGVEFIEVGTNFADIGTYAFEGEQFPVIYGTSYLRDEQGRIIVDGREKLEDGSDNSNYGMPMEGEEEVLGKVDPDFEVSFINEFSYKNISFRFQIDWRQGGYMYSGLISLLRNYGMTKETESRDELTVIDDAVKGVYDNNGNLVIEGENDIQIHKNQVYYSEVLWNIHESAIYKSTFVRLRNVNVNYKLPEKWFRNTFVTSANVFIQGSNLMLLYSAIPDIDPEVSTASGNGAGGFEYVALPNTRTLGGGFKIVF